MKKFVVAILAILYLSTSMGATLHFHYCMGKLVDWQLGNTKTHICGGCGMEKSDSQVGGCCRDEVKVLKNSLDQKIAQPAFHLLHNVTTVPETFNWYNEISSSSIIEEYPICHAPPLNKSGELYILNCVFRI